MTLAQRRWLLISFAAFCIIVSPLLILYASGYRYNTRLHKIEQVGLLSLSAQPGDAVAIINDKRYPIRNRLQQLTLPPNRYHIRLELDGYQAWEKTLDVESGRTTFARDIRLFSDREAKPTELFVDNLIRLGRQGQVTLFAAPQALVRYDADSQTVTEADLLQKDIPVRLPVFSGALAVFQQGTNWYQASVEAEAINIAALNVPNETRSLAIVDGTIFALTDTAIIELADDEATPLIAIDEPQSLAAAGRGWFVIAAEATHKRSFLYEITSANTKPEFITALPYSDGWRITSVAGTLLTLHDDTHQRLDLVDTRIVPPALARFDDVFDWQWSLDGRSVLTAAPNEVSIYHLQNGVNQELLLRQSETITSAAWSDDEAWVYYTSTQGVFAIERDDRDGRNVITLADKKTTPLLLGATTDTLVFSSRESTSFVIWSKALHNEE